MRRRVPQTSTSDSKPRRVRGWWDAVAQAWTRRRTERPIPTVPVLEEYEPRLLYSADLAPQALALTSGMPLAEQRVLDAHGDFVGMRSETAPQLELVIVDGAVAEREVLLTQIQSAPERRMEIITLDAAIDGIQQINDVLAGRSDVAALHIVSHGAEGEIRLGSSVLDATQLAARSGEIAQWGAALGADADVLLYGCDVAAGSVGEAFVRQLSLLTRADVAASSDLTGSAVYGSDWVLEFSTGHIGHSPILDSAVDTHWSGVLATFSVTTANGANAAGSLLRAINDANTTPGADVIEFNIPGAGPHTISPVFVLTITERVTIDGSINNGVAANGGLPAIILDGGSLFTNGLTLADGADGSVIRGLVIRDFNGNGIEIEVGADNITVANNFIGNFRADGTRAGGGDNNTGAGIHVNSLFNSVGGTAVADRNLIGGNDGAGILMEIPDGRSTLGFNNLLQNNLIGTEIDGTTALANNVGIQLDNGAQWNRILANTIAHNTGSGIVIGGSGAAVHDLLIGDGAGDENIIAFNGGDGVTVLSGVHNSIVRNSIHSNGGLGIDLRNGAASIGVTANDAGDADSGGNELQNAPVLASVQTVSPTQIRVIGTLNAVANTQHLVEFFANITGDPSGYGEGQTYLGNVTVTTNGAGIASFNTLINATLPAGSIISATATNFYTIIIVPVRGSTSEFANNVVVDNTAPVLDTSRSPQLNNVPANAPLPVGAVGTLVSALVDFSTPAGQLDNVTDADSGAQLGIAITGVDTANGTLYYTTNAGTGWTAVGAVSGSNALLLAADGGTRIYYRTNAGASGTLASAVTFRAWDRTTGTSGMFMDTSTNGGATAFSAATDTAALTVTAVNSAPVNTVPGAQSVNEDTALAIGGISVNDANGNLASTQLTVNSGVLNVGLSGGAVIVAGANGSADFTLGGTQAQINAALATLTYQGNLNFAGSDTLRVLSTDGAVTPLSDTDTVAITVNAVNDAPVSAGGSVAGVEDTAYVFTWADFNVSDVDTAISGATAVRVDVLPVSGVLEYFNGAGWTPVALGQLFSKAGIDGGALRFMPASDESGYDGYPTPGVGHLLQDYARFSFSPVQSAVIAIVNPDGEANGLADGVFQNPAVGWITSGADAGAQNLLSAVFPLDHDAALYVNDGATLTQTLAATFSSTRNYNLSFEFGWRGDAGYPTEPGFRVELWAGATLMGSTDQTVIAGIQGEFVSGVLAMTGTASGAVEGSALQIRLVGTSLQANFDNLRLVSFAASGDVGSTAIMNIDIVPVNDAPTASNLNTAESYTEDTALNLTDIVVSDIDSANVTATLTLSNIAAGSLSTATSGAVTSTYNPATGVWTASGAIADVNTLLAGVSFNPAANFSGGFNIATSVSDGVAPAVTGSKAITGVAVNDAPTATNLNAAESYSEDTALNLTNIVISDIDSANVTATLILSNAAAGSLSTATSGAVTSTYNPATGVWTASGAMADVNTLLAGLTFAPAADFNGAFTIAASVSDGVAAPVTGSKTMTGTAVNDPPTATNLNAAEIYTEDTALNLTNIVISDSDSGNVTATLTLSNTAAGSLSTATAGAVTSTYNPATGVWTASGALADVNTLLAGVIFNPALNFNNSFTITASVTDGVAAAVTGNKNMTGIPVNDAPAASNLNFAESYTEDTGLNLTDIVVIDVDSANITATLTLSNAAAGSLSTATSGAVTSTYNALTGVWAASGAIADVNLLLAGVSFNPAGNFNSNFTIATSVSDGIAAPVSGTKNVTGIAVNDAPTATNLNTAETYTEDVALNLADIVISDIDSTNVTATLTLSNIAAGSLRAATAGAVTSTYNPVTGVWTASGAIADVNTLLAGVTFSPALNFNGSLTIATRISDGAAAPLNGLKNVAGIAVNDVPVAAPDLLVATEDASITYLAVQLLTNDTDADGSALAIANVASGTGGTAVLNGDGTVTFVPNADFNGAANFSYNVTDGAALSSTVSVTVNVAAVNDTPATGPVTLVSIVEDGGAKLITQAELLANATDIDGPALTATGLVVSSGAGLLIDNGNGTWSYTPGANDDSAVSFAYDVGDGSATVRGSATLDILPVNDAPTNVVPGAQAVNEDTTLAIGGISVSDIDGNLASVRLTVANGTLNVSLTGGAVTTGGANDSANVVLGGTQAQINAALASLRYQGGANFNGTDTLTVVSTDGAGVPLSDADSIAIAVAPVNDVPLIGGAITGAVAEDAAPVLAAAGALTIADPDSGESSFAAQTNVGGIYGLFSVDAAGAWRYAATNNQSAIQQLAAGATLAETFTVSSSDGTASQNVVITITGVNDAPVIVANTGAAVDEGAGVTLTAAMLRATDVDVGATVPVYTLGATPAAGALRLGGVALSAGDMFTQADIDAGRVRYSHDGSETTADAIRFSVADDDGALTGPAVFSLAVQPVNDLPMASDRTFSVTGTSPVVFGSGDFGYADAEGAPLNKVRVVMLPGDGALLLDNVPVAANQEIQAADIAAGKFRYVPREGAAVSSQVSIGFQVHDGTAYSAAANVFSVVKNALAPGPSITPSVVADVPPVTTEANASSPVANQTVTARNDAAASRGVLFDVAPNTEALLQPLPTIDSVAVLPASLRAAGIVEVVSSRQFGLAGAQLLGALPFFVESGIPQIGMEGPRSAAESSAAERGVSASSNAVFTQALDRVRDEVKLTEDVERNILVSSVTLGAGMSVGYVIWLLRGGLLLTSLLSSLPAWRFVDPLPVLGRLQGENGEDEDEDGESLESIVGGEDEHSLQRPGSDRYA